MIYYIGALRRYNRCCSGETPPLRSTHRVDDAVVLVHAGDAFRDEFPEVVRKELRAVLRRGLFDLVHRRSRGDHLADTVVELDDLVDGYSSAVTHMVAFRAADGLVALFRGLVAEQGALRVGEDMLAFAGELAAARMTYGKDFLVWGEMMPAPTLNTGKTEYDYYVYRMDAANIRGQDYSGTTAVDSVVVSAFQYNGKIALFLCNITENDIAFDFDLNTGSLYGVDSGVIASGQSGYSAVINNGIAELNLPLPSRKVVMLTFDA